MVKFDFAEINKWKTYELTPYNKGLQSAFQQSENNDKNCKSKLQQIYALSLQNRPEDQGTKICNRNWHVVKEKTESLQSKSHKCSLN